MEKIINKKICRNCDLQFFVTDWDTVFLKKFDVPEPTSCPDCRRQKRLAQANQINLFERKCDATGEKIISNYPPDSLYKVYKQEYWFGEEHDDTKYGRDFDFKRPFFEQYAELALTVPRPALFTDYLHDENSAYTNYAGKNKNCYLIFDSDENWDCFYSYGMNGSKNSSDCYRVQKLELCYETVDSKNSFDCNFVYNSENCSDSYFLNNCVGCKYCIMCSNLRRKDYHILNEPVSKEKFEEMRKSFGSYKNLVSTLAKFNEFKLKFPQKYMRGMQNENATGNHLVHCKNALSCFDSMYIWDGKYCTQMFMKSRDCMDTDECGECELLYNSSHLAYNCYNTRFSMQCMNEVRDLSYCNLCFNSLNLFGCVGMRRKQYCILNKQYSQKEYEDFSARILAHMKKTGEFGEYFPIQTSAFPYNLTVAQEYYPLTREEALVKGYKWRDPDKRDYQPQIYNTPDDIRDVPDSILNELLACDSCGRNYKIVPAELKFYKNKNLPIPRKCFNCRHAARFTPRTPRHLWDRKCDKCGAGVLTAYPPERPETVYCEKCYLESLR